MAISGLNHVNIITDDLSSSIKFYVDVIGLVEGQRPAFKFPGAWLYCGSQAIIHLVHVDKQNVNGSGTIDHIALEANGIQNMMDLLEESQIAHCVRDVPGKTIRQIFLKDPNGVKIELNFRGSEVLTARTEPLP